MKITRRINQIKNQRHPLSPVFILGLLVVVLIQGGNLNAEDSKENPSEIDKRRSTAVALNYCRASFYRIRKNPTKLVMVEEREKILNNLNLNEIADQDVVKLYTGVLEEISDVQLAEKERVIMTQLHNRAFGEKLVVNAFALGADVTTFQYGSAIRTGASSWWDYRSMKINKEKDYFRIEKERVQKIVSKSSQFLDVFWKTAREKNIPDRWLVRSSDLDRLEKARAEADPEVRLRILKRMERFMECYPPYWYYVARTEQSLGHTREASRIYRKLAATGEGHFRKDEMLAAGLANLAAIESLEGKPDTAEIALKALSYDTDAWQVNLVCARILETQGYYLDAEDAILRNLDVNLEKPQSQTGLIALYYRTNNSEKLAQRLKDPEVVANVPAPALLLCMSKLKQDQVPAVAIDRINKTFVASVDLNFGKDDVIIQASPDWHLEHAKITLVGTGKEVAPQIHVNQNGVYEARFNNLVERGSPLNPGLDLFTAKMKVAYTNQEPFYIHLNQIAGNSVVGGNSGSRFANPYNANRNRIAVTGVEVGKTLLSFLPQADSPQTHVAGKPTLPVMMEKEEAPSIQKTSSSKEQVPESIPVAVPLDVKENSPKSTSVEKEEVVK